MTSQRTGANACETMRGAYKSDNKNPALITRSDATDATASTQNASLPATQTSISLPASYNHPYTPYQIQTDLMDSIYTTINNYKIGTFESPTGTGKTLSIICSTMTWLRNYKKSSLFSNMSDDDSSSDEEWVKNDYQQNVLSTTKNKLKDYEVYLSKIQSDYEKNIQEVIPLEPKFKKPKIVAEVDYLPKDYVETAIVDANTKVKNEIEMLLQKDQENEMTNECPIKIYFSSRTHSQLNQFGNQLNLTKFNSSFEGIEERTKYLPFASRKQLCINPKVNTLSDSNINDGCIDLQNNNGCEFLPKKGTLQKKFSDLSLSKIHDIEELTSLGGELKVCPYYSIRNGIEMTEIISLPYQMLLQSDTRRVLNLDIKNSIIVIDEAHNLLDTITSLYSVSISVSELETILKSLQLYLNKFLKRLNSGNRINLMKLIKVCKILVSFIERSEKDGMVKVGNEINIGELLNSNGDLFNIHKLETFLNTTKIAYKIESYIQKADEETATQGTLKVKTGAAQPLLFKIVKFLKSLSNPSNEGKFFWDGSGGGEISGNTGSSSGTSINYMLLDPSAIFKAIVDDSKCVLLFGGTLEPISDFTNYLFPSVPVSQINSFSCGHIIPDENLKVFTIPKYKSQQFDFLFSKRNEMITNLGELIIDISNRVPFGLVVFFPSYQYLNKVLSIWKSTKLYQRIENIKSVFEEPTNSSKVESMLANYTDVIKTQKRGAILFSVVGGKMSEGINFSDELARGVIMVGLPFPNSFSGEIIAKRRFIEERTIERGGTREEASANSRAFYENLCMKSVNQSIGRSIRHNKDYSTIFLVDHRYEGKIQEKLSGWVRERVESKDLEIVLEEVGEFFVRNLQ